MATYVKTILPSGKGLWLEKLTTKQYRAVSERVMQRVGDNVTGMAFTDKLSHELLLASLRGVTAEIIPVVMTQPSEAEIKAGLEPDWDIDAMLASVPEHGWIRPTYEDLITDGPRSLDNLLDDAGDYSVAKSVAGMETLGGAGAYRGKRKREFVGQ
jgi:hypothetical protein